VGDSSHKASTDFDRTDKEITPMGGFAHYGMPHCHKCHSVTLESD